MQLGILSDTHDNLLNLLAALEIFREQGTDTLIHCGDLTGLEMISHFSGFRIIYTFGNMDFSTGTIKKRIEKMCEDNFAGLVFKGQFENIPVAATHSHIEGELSALISSQHYKWVFHGHTHKKRDEIIHGVRVVNPGALGGLVKGPRSICIVDLISEDIKFINI
jgi:hypothetical protein